MIWGFAGISGSFLVAVFSVNQLHAAGSVYRLTFSQRAPRITRPHEVGGGRTVRLRSFHAGIHGLHGRAYFPPAITPAVGRPARCTVALPGDTGSVGDAVPHQQQASSQIWRVAASPIRVLQAQITQRCTRYVTMHPLRRDAPDQKGCNAYGSGAPPHRQQARPRAIPPHRPQPSASDATTRPRHAHPGSEREALHHLGSITPVSEHYTTSELV